MAIIWIFTWLLKIVFWAAVLFLPLSISYYFYLKHRSRYFQSLGIPHLPVKSLFLGNLPEYEKDGKLHDKLLEWSKKYGPTFGMMQGGDKVIVTSDLKILHEIFLKQFHTFQTRQLHPSFAVDQENDLTLNVFGSQGRRWKRLRSLFSASLTIGKIKSVDPIINKASKELVAVFKETEGGVVDVVP
uniref:Cytochrome P450 n=1 Tax=Panagrolaimus davidi TaxID=227884 RepID=A0A914QRK2_9BILA